jgi:hypothetical protein
MRVKKNFQGLSLLTLALLPANGGKGGVGERKKEFPILLN